MAAKQILVVAAMLLAGASVGTLWMGGEQGSESRRRNLPVVQGPELADEFLKASVTTSGLSGERQIGSEVRLSGRMHREAVDEIVFCSQESPDMLRLGWEAPDHLVISLPQYPQDAGKAPGAGDSGFLCASTIRAVRVSCETYPVGARK